MNIMRVIYISVALSLAAPAGDVVLPDLDPKDVASTFLGCPVIGLEFLMKH